MAIACLVAQAHSRLRSCPAAQVPSNNFKNLSSENNRIYSVAVLAECEHTGR